jgi:hypothetical protein
MAETNLSELARAAANEGAKELSNLTWHGKT